MEGELSSETTRRASEVSRVGSEPARGGADALDDTVALTESAPTPTAGFNVVSRREESTAGNKLVWLLVIVALGVVLAYAAGMLR
ncbi:MAG: hypothetical protein ACJ792_05545 [Gemmatimonadaceae bacterium]